MKKFVLLMAVICMAPSAVYAEVISKVIYQESSARNLEPEHNMVLTPLIADIKVSPNKITYTETQAFEKIPVNENLNIDAVMPNFKSIALSRAAHAYNADLLVGTVIDVVTNAQGRLEITVTGYPANYVNFRNATANDIDVVKKARDVRSGKNLDILESPKHQLNAEFSNTKKDKSK